MSCLTKLEKLLCLKYLGSKSLANSGGFQTTKLLLVGLHDSIGSVAGSSTMSYVLLRNGGGPVPLGIGDGVCCCCCAPPPPPSPPPPPPLEAAESPSVVTADSIIKMENERGERFRIWGFRVLEGLRSRRPWIGIWEGDCTDTIDKKGFVKSVCCEFVIVWT